MPPPAATPEIVAVAPCAWLETVDAANPAATARATRMESNFDTFFILISFQVSFFGLNLNANLVFCIRVRGTSCKNVPNK
jgi:hypothetical protein